MTKRILVLLMVLFSISALNTYASPAPSNFLTSDGGELQIDGFVISSGSEPIYMNQTPIYRVKSYLDYDLGVTLTFYDADGVSELQDYNAINEDTILEVTDGNENETYNFEFEKLLNNGKIKFQSGNYQDSIISDDNSDYAYDVAYKGNIAGPMYYDGSWYQLTYGNSPLMTGYAIGGTNNDGWNNNGTYTNIMNLLNVDYHIFNGKGYIVTYSQVTVDDMTVDVKTKYTLEENDSFVRINSTVSNNTESDIPNVRVWFGTSDDYVGNDDGPVKKRGNIVNGAFEVLSDKTLTSDAISITSSFSGQSAIFVTSNENAYTTISHLGFTSNIFNQDPRLLATTITGDNSYAIYYNLGDLAPGEKATYKNFYITGNSGNLGDILSQIDNNLDLPLPEAPTVNPVSPLDADTVILTGTAEPGATVVITNSKMQGYTFADAVTGEFSLEMPLGQDMINNFTAYAINESGDSDTITFLIVEDGTAPVLTLSTTVPAITNLALIPFNILSSEAIDGIQEADLNIVGGEFVSVEKIDETHYTAYVSTTGSGVNVTTSTTIKVKVLEDSVSDLVGHTNAESNEVTVISDRIAVVPQLTTEIESPINTTSAIIKVTVNEPIQGFDSKDVSVTNGTVRDFTALSDTVYQFTVDADSEGSVEVWIDANQFSDMVGNNNVASNLLTFDVDITKPTGSFENADVTTKLSVVTLTSQASDDSDLEMSFWLNDTLYSDYEAYNTSKDITLPTPGNYNVKMYLRDAAGNVSDSIDATISYTKKKTSSGGNTTEKPDDNTSVIVDGKEINAGTETETVNPDTKKTELKITVSASLVEEQLNQAKNNTVVQINITKKADTIINTLTADMVKKMQDKTATLNINTPIANYNFKASAIDLDQLTNGTNFNSPSLEDIVIDVKAAVGEEINPVIFPAFASSRIQPITPPVTFEMSATYNGKTIAINQFDNFVERVLPLPDDADLKTVTTGVVIEEDGSLRHVPTKVFTQNGKLYASINSLTNSSYVLVSNDVSFDDINNHWAESTIDNLSDRMIVAGFEGHFLPDNSVTRAEFLTMLTKALGLKQASVINNALTDVNEDDWFAPYVQTALDYDFLAAELVKEDKALPNQAITREEVMTIIAKAIEMTELDKSLVIRSDAQAVYDFSDFISVSPWAIQGVKDCVDYGLVSGYNNALMPKESITRAEVLSILESLLKSANLI